MPWKTKPSMDPFLGMGELMIRKKTTYLIRFFFLALLPFLVLKPILVYAQNGQSYDQFQRADRSFTHCFQVFSSQDNLRHVQKVAPELPSLIPGITKAKAPSRSDNRFKMARVYSRFLPESFLILRI